MPPAWVDLFWELVQDRRDNVKYISLIIYHFCTFLVEIIIRHFLVYITFGFGFGYTFQ
jgi:hypothetical protein